MTKCVFVVDDNALMRTLLTATLRAGGYEVAAAGSGLEALARMRESAPGVVLMDLQMPEMSGADTLRAMRADPELRAVPVLAITAFLHPDGRDAALADGFDGYLAKPIPSVRLLQEVGRRMY
ncbi:MAG TPA: response regulator [Terriglobales bacterium]|jgi:two-component system cell cycle response regulator DivK